MNADYPEYLLAREPAPPYEGEGSFALWHFSEDPSLGRFRPHRPATNPGSPPLVWAVDTRHAPMFWFPRDCPRGCIWPGAGLRITPSIWPFWRRVADSTVGFSGSRLGSSAPHPDRFG